MMNKTIKISQANHNSLSKLASYYYTHEEFSDEEGKFYNEEIEKFENGNLENVKELTLESLEERINKLELELKR